MSARARFRERLEDARLVHVDARALALHLLGHPPYPDLTRLLFEGLRAGEIAGQTSSIALYQVLVEPYRRNRDDLAERAGDDLTAFRGLEVVPVGAAIARQAAQVRARLGGSTERALHLATALDAGADLYLTQASGLRRVAGLEILDLDDYASSERKTSPEGSLGQK